MKYFLFLTSFILCSCGPKPLLTDKKLGNPANKTINETELKTYKQNISIIYDVRFINWIETHKNDTIVTITTICYRTQGITSGFIIIWTPGKIEK